jgi:hypothetical protein
MSGIFVGVVCALVVAWGAPAVVPTPVPAPLAMVSCAEDVAACDSDGDGVGDLVEEAICGSATCATGEEDVDGDGVTDAEQLAGSLEQGGVGGPVQFPEFGVVRLVFPGPMVVEFLWVPVALLLLVAAAATVFLVRARVRG